MLHWVRQAAHAADATYLTIFVMLWVRQAADAADAAKGNRFVLQWVRLAAAAADAAMGGAVNRRAMRMLERECQGHVHACLKENRSAMRVYAFMFVYVCVPPPTPPRLS